MAEHTFFNGGPVSVVYTASGLSLDSQDRVAGSDRNPVLAGLVASGQLTDLGPTEPPAAAGPVEDEPAE